MARPRCSMATMMLAVAAAGAYCWFVGGVLDQQNSGHGASAAWRIGLIAVAGLVALWIPIATVGWLRRDSTRTRLASFLATVCLLRMTEGWIVLAVLATIPAVAIFQLPVALAYMHAGAEVRSEIRKSLAGLCLILLELTGLALSYLLIIQIL